jgi:hypothetical protein
VRIFNLVRSKDISGISGTGLVANGVEFPCGKVVICWCVSVHSITVFDSIEQLIKIHGHEGATKIEFIKE